MTFCLSVENMVTLHPCFCFFMKALFFLTTFQTSSEDIYTQISTGTPIKEMDEKGPFNPIVPSLHPFTYFDITKTK